MSSVTPFPPKRIQVHGVLATTDAAPRELHVADLQTPLGTVPHALLRVSDIIAFEAAAVPLAPPEA